MQTLLIHFSVLPVYFWNSCVEQLGPEKGVIHLATAAVLNAVWDLWARAEGKVGPSLSEELHSLPHWHDSQRVAIFFPVAAVEAACWHGEARHMFYLHPGLGHHEGTCASFVCRFRIPSRLWGALTSDTSLMCLQRRRLSVRPISDALYSLGNEISSF